MRSALKPKPSPLFVSDEELRHRLAPRMGRRRFRTTIRALELRNFPKLNPLFNGRYLPAIVAWLDAEHGIGKNLRPVAAEDGEEHWPNADAEQ